MEKFQHLESVSKQLQEENERLSDAVKELKRKLSKTQAEAANTKLSMAQRTCQFQLIQEELLEKASRTTKLEQEVSAQKMPMLHMISPLLPCHHPLSYCHLSYINHLMLSCSIYVEGAPGPQPNVGVQAVGAWFLPHLASLFFIHHRTHLLILCNT